ncbi:MAG: hypothetical protein KKD13_04930 [Candidatus Margulisbacteria bacterium]|nr:hypothetical protein [Candidatus Margulisiibacteriota bacterium]
MKHLLIDTLRSRFFRLQRIERRGTEKYKAAVGNIVRRTAARITDSSRANLEALARVNPQETKKALAGLRGVNCAIEMIVVPASLSREGLKFSINDGVARLKNDRPRGKKEAVGYQPQPLMDLIPALNKETRAFTSDPEYGGLFLYKAILRVRVELYKAGETRSAARKQGLPLAADPFQEICSMLAYFIDNFPFSVERDKISLQKTVNCLRDRGNNVAADAGLQYLTQRLVKRLDEQMVARLRRARPAQDWKISPSKTRDDKGFWIINQVGYRQTPSGVLRRESIPHRVSTAKLLRMIDHEQDKVAQELEDNKVYLERIRVVAADPLGNWPELLELYDRFTSFFAWHKDKACVELEAALHVTLVGSDQAVSLARSLLGVAEETIDLRQLVLTAQARRIKEIRQEAEKKIVGYLMRFTVSIINDLGDPRAVSDPRWVGYIERRLGGLLGTFLKDDISEPWLGRCKSRVYGLKRALPKLYDPTLTRAEKIAKLKKGAYFILQIGFIYENRNREAANVAAWQSYISRYQELLDRFDRL